MNSRRNKAEGFALVEQLVVVAFIGILAAIALLTFLELLDRARYTEVDQTLGVIALDLQVYHDTHDGRYPDDEEPGFAPDGSTHFPTRDTPFDSPYDYDSFRTGDVCRVEVSHYGKNKQRDSNYKVPNGRIGEIVTIQDDRVLLVSLGSCGTL